MPHLAARGVLLRPLDSRLAFWAHHWLESLSYGPNAYSHCPCRQAGSSVPSIVLIRGSPMKSARSDIFHQGQVVLIRSAAEVAATLDAEGKLEGLPFMPEMARLCGTRARVHRHVDKTCVEGGGFRRMATTILLADLRCDGSSHDGCQRNCLFFWKQAWLKPVEQEARPEDSEATSATALANLPTCENGQYLCQSTDLFAASQPMSRWNLTHFFTEIRRGELTLSGFLAIFIGTTFDRLRGLLGFRKVGSPTGSHRRNSMGDLDLRPGE